MKSHLSQKVKGQLDILRRVYLDACDECAVNPSPLDLRTVERRVLDEGASFLTLTLPIFCQDFERSLANGRIDSQMFVAFTKCRKGATIQAIPAFLQGMLSLIFDRTTGVMYEHPSIPCDITICIVRAVRQICRTYAKLTDKCSPMREHKAVEAFIQNEHLLSNVKVHQDDVLDFYRVCRLLWDPLFVNFDQAELDPAHGPGTSAEGISRINEKYRWKTWHDRLETYFPFLGFALPLGAAGEKEFLDVKYLTEAQEMPSRVLLVPKTMKGPRIIAAEPLAAQFAQQGLRSYLYRTIGRSRLLGTQINFRDQTVNQKLALMSSKDGSMATLDLSDASDRVIRDLAMCMFHGTPTLAGAVEACRTKFAKVPDGTVVGPLRKFASMGSALCFPVEAMYFYTICVVALIRERNLQFDAKSIRKVGRSIFVYGDDIVVPQHETVAVIDHLQKYYCKVNVHKSFWTGKFRESCGMDAYNGTSVTPTYIRRHVPYNRQQHTEIISIVASANSFYRKGYWKTARFLFERIERLVGTLPLVASDSPAVGRNTYLQWRSVQRWNRSLQRYEILALTVEPVNRTDLLDGYAALGKSLLSLKRQVNLDDRRDPLHLERSARHGVAALKRRWVSVNK